MIAERAVATLDVIERVRLGAELVVADAIARETATMRVLPVVPETETQRRFLLSHALLLTPSMAKDAYAAATEAARALGCTDKIEIFHARDRGDGRRARLVLHGEPIGIELAGDCLAVHDRAELVAIFGHEIGHCLAHTSHPQLARVVAAVSGASAKSRRIWSLASELTADRLGLLACRDLDAVLRLEMRGAMGHVPALVLDTTAYLDQCRVLGEELLARRRLMFGQTHPEHYVRGWALSLFYESDVYRALTGQGPGCRTLESVDVLLDVVLGVTR